jgi:hypothetical protein
MDMDIDGITIDAKTIVTDVRCCLKWVGATVPTVPTVPTVSIGAALGIHDGHTQMLFAHATHEMPFLIVFAVIVVPIDLDGIACSGLHQFTAIDIKRHGAILRPCVIRAALCAKTTAGRHRFHYDATRSTGFKAHPMTVTAAFHVRVTIGLHDDHS